MRKPIIAGNWKMNKTNEEAIKLLSQLKELIKDATIDIVVCPTFLSLQNVSKELADTNIHVGAQNMHWEESGAYTGEVSAEMLNEIGVEYVIIGHSERREYFNEKDETVNKKIIKALNSNLIPILCVGESLDEREKGIQEKVVAQQLRLDLKDINIEEIKKVIIAYEPIWAIGTGKTATSEQADEMCGFIRNTIMKLYDDKSADNIRIQYGGSVKPANIKELMSMENIDGALVGGASLKLDFADLVNYNK